jgi:hypothetical protein
MLLPKLRLGQDVYVWPFEIALPIFIIYIAITNSKITIPRVSTLPLVFFIYSGVIFLIASSLIYDLKTGDLLRWFKMLLYSSGLIFFCGYYHETFSINPSQTLSRMAGVIRAFVFVISILALMMLGQILYNFIVFGVPPAHELVWGFSSRQRPYLYSGRYFDLSGIHDIQKGTANATASIYTLGFFLSIYLFRRTRQWVYLLTTLIALTTVLMSFSRSGFVVFTLTFFLIFLKLKPSDKLKLALLLLPVLVACFAFGWEVLTKYTVVLRFKMNVQSGMDPSSAKRIAIWAQLMHFDWEKILLLITGYGYGSQAIRYALDKFTTFAESTLLSLVLWGGWSASLFVWFYYRVWRAAKKLLPTDRFLSIILSSFLIAFILPNIFTGGDLLIDAMMQVMFIFFAILLAGEGLDTSNRKAGSLCES